MPSPKTDPLDPLSGPTNADAHGHTEVTGPHTGGRTDESIGGADNSPLENLPSDQKLAEAERLRSEGKSAAGDPAGR